MTTWIAHAAVLYRIQSKFRAAYRLMLIDRFIAPAQRTLLSYADVNGVIPWSALSPLLVQLGTNFMRIFVGPDGRSAYTDPADPAFHALSPFADLLDAHLVEVTYRVVKAHSLYLRKNLPQDVQDWLSGTVGEQQGSFRPNPLATYDPAHTWVDPSGYTLSDRIWRTGSRIRMQMDAYLTDSIRRGLAALTISRGLEQFLLPGRAPLRTSRPYGTDASLDAMRLARSEIARAHAQASLATSRANPFVTGLDWALSAQHPKFDICDRIASIGMAGQRLRDPYPLDGAPLPVQNSHPNCLCHVRPVVSATHDAVIASLRAMRDAIADDIRVATPGGRNANTPGAQFPSQNVTRVAPAPMSGVTAYVPLTPLNAESFTLRLMGSWATFLVSALRFGDAAPVRDRSLGDE